MWKKHVKEACGESMRRKHEKKAAGGVEIENLHVAIGCTGEYSEKTLKQ